MTKKILGLPDIILASVLGSWLAWSLLGPRALDPFNISWMISDPADYAVGWGFFRHERSWHMPLLWSDDLGYPLGISTAYWDIIPPLALAFRILNPILPETFQYFGPYGLLCCILQFYFALKLCRELTPDRPAALLCGALFIGCAPPFVLRILAGHFALASQWLILAALTQLFTLRAQDKPILSLLAINLLAASINPYIAVTVFMVTLGVIWSRSNTTRRPMLWRGIETVAILAAMVLVMLTIGFISARDPESSMGEGYGRFSMNLLAPIDPMNFPSIVLPRLPEYFFTQYEGYNYLGAGALALGFVSLCYRPRLLGTAFADHLAARRWIFLGSLGLALSSYATIGTWMIYNLRLPEPVIDLLATFRASGRLFWPGYYIVLTTLFAVSLAAFPRRIGTFLIAGAFALQFFDTSSLRAASRNGWDNASVTSPLHAPAWHNLKKGGYRHLVVLPAWQCVPAGPDGSAANGQWTTPGGVDGYHTFGLLAVDQGLTLNSFYAPRLSTMQRRYFCHEQTEQIRLTGPMADTAYVFAAGDPLAAIIDHRNGETCRLVDGFTLCTRR